MLGFNLCYKKIRLRLCPASYLLPHQYLHIAIAKCVVGFHTSWWFGVSCRPWTLGMTEGTGGGSHVWAKGSIQGGPSFSTTFWKSSERGWQPERGSRWELTACLLMAALLSLHREKIHLVSEWPRFMFKHFCIPTAWRGTNLLISLGPSFPPFLKLDGNTHLTYIIYYPMKQKPGAKWYGIHIPSQEYYEKRSFCLKSESLFRSLRIVTACCMLGIAICQVPFPTLYIRLLAPSKYLWE